jgi:hypothetical protein
MLDLALLLELAGIDPRQTLALRHRPLEPALRRILPTLAEEEPDLFNLYQRSHGPRAEAAVRRARYVAAFIGHEPAKAVFVGLYERTGERAITPEWSRQYADYQRLVGLGLSPWEEVDSRPTALLFDLDLLDAMNNWKGRLVVGWPSSDRAWFRRLNEQNHFPVLAINQDSLLVSSVPRWQELCLAWSDLQALPSRWQAALSQWRGIYLVFDASDGKAYVGSACGGENILGRWRGYAASGHGGNLLLRDRDPRNFVFSIVQLLSPDVTPDEVVALESNWKTRLHTRHPHGLNAN